MKKIVFHGDSLTEGAEIERQHTWPVLVENRLRLEVVNSGIGGDTSGGLLGRFSYDVVRRKPDAVLVLCGTNDLWWGLDEKTVAANIFAMAFQAQHHDIAPVLGTPLPLHLESMVDTETAPPAMGFEKFERDLAKLAEFIKISAENSEITCIDFYNLFLDENKNTRKEYFLEDGLHPNRSGHRLMAEKTADVLKTVFFLP